VAQIRRSACLFVCALVVLGGLVVGGQPAAAAMTVSMTVPGVPYVSQLTEPSPAGWRTDDHAVLRCGLEPLGDERIRPRAGRRRTRSRPSSRSRTRARRLRLSSAWAA